MLNFNNNAPFLLNVYIKLHVFLENPVVQFKNYYITIERKEKKVGEQTVPDSNN
jgi:hypothetical protein